MAKRHSIKHLCITVVTLATLLSVAAVAQEARSEVSVQGTGFFTKNSNGNGIRNQAENTGGLLVGYRYNINRWLAAEANYGFDRNTQSYFGGVSERVETNVHTFTGSAVVKLPTIAKLEPYLLGGGGALLFDPTSKGSNFGATRQAQGTFVYGGGADYAFTRHISIRAEYRGYVYKAPDFNLTNLRTDTWTHVASPSAGIVFHF